MPTRELLRQLNSHRKVERLLAFKSLLLLGKKGRAVLRRALSSSNWYTRELAARGLGKIGESSDLESLVPLLADRSYKVRKAAIKSIILLLLRMDISLVWETPNQLDDLAFGHCVANGCSAKDFIAEYLDPKDAEDWVALAALHLEESQPEEAFAALLNAYDADRSVFTEDAYYYLWEQVFYLASLRQFTEEDQRVDIADRALTIMLELRPNDTMVMLSYGSYLSALGRYEDAYRVYRRALVINPRDHFITANLQGLPLTRQERRRLDAEIAGSNVVFLPPGPNLGSDGVISYSGQFVQIQIPNPPFKRTPGLEDKMLGAIVANFLAGQGLKSPEFEIYGAELINTSQGAPTLFIDVVLRDGVPH